MSSINICFSISEDKIRGFSEVKEAKQLNSSNCPFQLLSSSSISELDQKIQQRAGNNLSLLVFSLTGQGKPIKDPTVFLGIETISGTLTPKTTQKGEIYELIINIPNHEPIIVDVNQNMGKCLFGESTKSTSTSSSQKHVETKSPSSSKKILSLSSSKVEPLPIENISFTDCFMNSIFQVIMHDTLLKTALIETYQKQETPKAKAFCQAVKDYSEGKTVSTNDLRTFMPVKVQTGQQDAAEFLQSLLNDVSYSNYPGLFASLKLTYNWEIKGFFGLGSVIESRTTEATHQQYMIPLEITSTDGAKLIDSYFTKKAHFGDRYTDELSKKVYSPGQVQTHVVGTPDRLVFQLKRFNLNNKISSTVEMPEKIQVNGSSYTLKKIVMHHGTSKNSGHYTSLLEDGVGHWTKTDDKKITKLNDSSEYRKNGYLYFYELEISKS